MSKENYFNITDNAKNYPDQPWHNSSDYACFAIPCEEGMNIMSMYEAMAFVASNDISSMIALRIPEKDYNECMAQKDEEYRFKIKDEYFIDYIGKSII